MSDCDFLPHYFYLGHLCVEDTFGCGKVCELAVLLGERVYMQVCGLDVPISNVHVWCLAQSHFGGCFCLLAPKFWADGANI